LAEHSPLGFPFEEYGKRQRAAVALPLERRPLIALTWTSECIDLGHLVPYWLSTPAVGFGRPSRCLVVERPHRCDTNPDPLMPLARVQSRIDASCPPSVSIHVIGFRRRVVELGTKSALRGARLRSFASPRGPAGLDSAASGRLNAPKSESTPVGVAAGPVELSRTPSARVRAPERASPCFKRASELASSELCGGPSIAVDAPRSTSVDLKPALGLLRPSKECLGERRACLRALPDRRASARSTPRRAPKSVNERSPSGSLSGSARALSGP